MSRSYILSALTLATLAVVTPATYGAGSLILQDNFESYPDTASMNAVWNGNPASTSTLSTNRPGIVTDTTTQALNNSPTASGQQAQEAINPTAIKPSNTNPIFWQFDYFWDGTGNKRMTAGIRMGSNYILEMGYYNASYSPFGATASGMSVRTVNVLGSGSLPEGATANGWRIMPNADNTTNYSLSGLANTWFTFSALIQGNTITYTIDAGRDGTIDSTYVATAPTLDLTAAAFDTARLGTGLTSTGGGADFDNVLIRSLAPGDANHDGVINADDYALIDRGAAKALTGWSNGDFNNDGVIDQNDYLLIDTSYLQQTPSAAASLLASRDAQFGDAYVSELVAAVPEPILTAPLALLALTFANRRRRA
ncbi:MAG TPA: dockerin type I repeat-containing protein [Tepidisphaeraceae bacterium]|jgi:hypothetical protein|nr:dockerin type I repeat-containing protein [Tepidisphaeraceae bacterium]